jgi:hypothetical protein
MGAEAAASIGRKECRASPALVSPLGTPHPRRPHQRRNPQGGKPIPPRSLIRLALLAGAWGPWGRIARATGPGAPFGSRPCGVIESRFTWGFGHGNGRSEDQRRIAKRPPGPAGPWTPAADTRVD